MSTNLHKRLITKSLNTEKIPFQIKPEGDFLMDVT